MSAMQYRFSPSAARVLTWAQIEAERLGNESVEAEHILLGLLEEKQGVTARIFQRNQINPENIKVELHESLKLLPKTDAKRPELSEDAQKVLDLGLESANTLESKMVGPEHLLIGLLRNIGNKAYPILRRAGITYANVLADLRTLPPERPVAPQPVTLNAAPAAPQTGEKMSFLKILSNISISFWGMVIVMVGSGMAAYYRWIDPGVAVFLFVAVGWVVSVSLHEFGHALMAYMGGDYSVINKGYLTLNPLRYSHGTLSILLPLLVLVMGGIGLPGGAVYINMAAIPSKKMRSLVSAAGPIMTGLFTLVLVIFVTLGTNSAGFLDHLEFWAGVSFLTFLQITAFVFNLIPLPPLDGFGILMPFLPKSIVTMLMSIGRFTFFIIMFVFLSNNFIRDYFWDFISRLIALANLNASLVGGGFDLFSFWNN